VSLAPPPIPAAPLTPGRYGLAHGAAFGLSHGLDQLAILRPAAAEPALPGFYHVGASARPGNGVPLVMIGARLAAERILRDLGASAAAAP